ncbi:MAG: hypothetical protein JWO06_2955 [Bacteroidota bacterium]|nr:hypothetical protein [Bacteroidota bacterium]
MSMKKHLLCCAAIALTLTLFAQQSSVKWRASIESQKVFIENKGQFNSQDKMPDSKILFGTDAGPCMVYFTRAGLTYRLDKKEVKPIKRDTDRRAGVENEKEEHNNVKVTTDLVHMEWLNSNPDVKVTPKDGVSNYFSYSIDGKNINHVRACETLVYENLYPNIDVEYVFHPQGGIEYSLVLHPGANISQVKMKYSDLNHVSLDGKGNTHLSTSFGDIIDHAPVTSYSGWYGFDHSSEKIPSRFIRNGKVISFELGIYDHTKTVVIDPWTTVPAMPTANSVFYIKADSAGNAYIYGGDSPFRLEKYDATGVLQWTYNTSWSSSNTWFGALAVDRAGNSYITDGDGATLSKIDTGAAIVWSHSSANAPADAIEFWAIDFNCDQTQLYVGGTRDIPLSFDFHGDVFKMDMTNGNISSYVSVVHPTFNFTTIGFNEVRSMCFSPNGNLYYLTIDTVGSVDQTLNINYGQPSGYHFPYYLPYSNSGGGQGQNNIRATAQYLYTTDGQTLHKRDITTGLSVDSATIPGGSSNNNSGVAIDSCGNVYVGSQNKVVKYDPNLVFITSASTPEAVFDVSIGANGDVLACGHNFAVALALSACGQVKTVCQTILAANASATNIPCGSTQCTGTATANPLSGTGPYTYHWPSGHTTQTDTGLCAGSYTVTITDATNATVTASATVVLGAGASVTITANKTVMCSGDSAEICAPGGFVTYNWNNGLTTPCIEAKLGGNYYVDVSDNNNCTASSNHIAIDVHALPPVSISVNGDTLTAYNSLTYQWYLNGTPISGATSHIYIATQNGDYSVAVSDSNGCTALSNKASVTTGIENLTGDGTVKVYPNPLETGNWHVDVSDEWIGSNCDVYDADGKLVYRSTIRNRSSEISLNVARGIYMMKIYSVKRNLALKLIRL